MTRVGFSDTMTANRGSVLDFCCDQSRIVEGIIFFKAYCFWEGAMPRNSLEATAGEVGKEGTDKHDVETCNSTGPPKVLVGQPWQ